MNKYLSACSRHGLGGFGSGHPNEPTSLFPLGASVVSMKGACDDDNVTVEPYVLTLLLCSLLH